MSQLTDAIREAGPDAVANTIRDMPDWQVFRLLYDTPEEIIPACDRMGWQTLEELIAWVQAVNAAVRDTVTFVDLVDPPVPFTLTGMPKVDMPTIHKAIVDQAKTREDFFIDQSDATYHLASKQQWEILANMCPVRRRNWAADIGDCDDYANAFRGWLATKGFGNLAQGFCSITMYGYDGSLVGGHAVVLVMDDTKTLWFLDPQTAKLYPPSYAKLGGAIFAKTVKVARAYF